MISVSGGRACRDRDGVARLAVLGLRVVPRRTWRPGSGRRWCACGGANLWCRQLVFGVGGLTRQQRRHLGCDRRHSTRWPSPWRPWRWIAPYRARRHAVIPAGHPDQQDGGRREEHQREPLDERIAAVDRAASLMPRELAAVEQEIRGRHGDEQDQRRLDDGGEDPGLAHREHREDAAQRIRRGEDHAQLFVARAGVVGEADGGQRDRDQHRTPPRNTRDVGVRRAMVGRDGRPRALS